MRYSENVLYLGNVCCIISYPIVGAIGAEWKRTKKSSEDGQTEVDASQKFDLS